MDRSFESSNNALLDPGGPNISGLEDIAIGNNHQHLGDFKAKGLYHVATNISPDFTSLEDQCDKNNKIKEGVVAMCLCPRPNLFFFSTSTAL